jgi:diaminohydroxyphosphoribosylaminopyrimidine deaminase/5-amino-6-(5-phosphoribosylamino)uracil reductase
MAPVLLGSSARPLLELPFTQMAERMALRITAIEAVGDDWRISALPHV